MASMGRSGIWEYFTKVIDGEDAYLQCSLCEAKYKCVNGSTTGARQHLKLKHSELHRQLKADDEKRQGVKRPCSSADVSVSRQSPVLEIVKSSWKPTDRKEERLTDLILAVILKQNLPFSFVEEPTFKALMQEAAPDYVIPESKAFSTTHLETAMQKQVQKIREKITRCNSHGFALTSDIWNSRTGDSYVDLHACFIDENFKSIHCELLDVLERPATRTTRNILEKWNRPLGAYGINLKGCETFITCDSGSDMVKAREMARFNGISCIGHDLHLAVLRTMHAVPEVHAAFQSGSYIVGYIKRSEATKKKLKKTCKSLKMEPLNVIQHVATRSNSYLHQEARLQQLKPAIFLMSTKGGNVPTRSEAEWTIAQQCVEILRPIEQLTKSLNGQLYPTLSARAPTIQKVEKDIEEILGSMLFHEKVVEFGVMLQSSLNFYRYGNRNESTEKWSQAATSVDPRFKLILFDDESSERVRQTLLELHDKVRERLQSDTDLEVRNGKLNDAVATGWEFLEERKEAREALPVDFNGELQQFWDAEWIQINECPLKWWKANKTRFPNVAKLAQILLAVPATSTTNERLWSTAGNIVVPNRESLDSSRLTDMLYTRAALNTPDGHCSTSHDFSETNDDVEE